MNSDKLSEPALKELKYEAAKLLTVVGILELKLALKLKQYQRNEGGKYATNFSKHFGVGKVIQQIVDNLT